MIGKRNQRSAIVLLEAVVATTLIAGVLAILTQAIVQFARQSDVLVTRQRAMLAAEAVLNEIRNGHEPTSESFAARFPAMRFEVTRTEGDGDWVGCRHVIVKVRATTNRGVTVRVRLDGYVREAVR